MGMNSQRDLQLINLIRQDDDKALESLFKAYYNSLCHFATFLTRRDDLADEIVSDVFIRLWEIRKTLVVDRNLKAYLFRATRNTALNYLRQEKNVPESLDPETEQADYNPVDILIYNELESGIHSLIDTLPQQRKVVFQLNRFDGLTYQEIADILAISIKTVESQMGKALKQLRHLYKTKQS